MDSGTLFCRRNWPVFSVGGGVGVGRSSFYGRSARQKKIRSETTETNANPSTLKKKAKKKTTGHTFGTIMIRFQSHRPDKLTLVENDRQ